MIIPVVIKKEYFTYAAPFLNLKYTCTAVNTSVNITGNKAGYKRMLPLKSPFSNSINERCMPQPGQSIPISALEGQVSRWFSNQ